MKKMTAYFGKLYKFLFLASGEKNGEGFWYVGIKNSDENILDR